MAFQPVADTAEIAMIFTNNGVTVQNVYYALRPGGYGQADLQALADVIDAIFLTTFMTEVTVECAYVRTEVRGLAVINDLIATQNAGAGIGTHIGAPTPNNCTFAIKKSSGLTGRSARGRTYWVNIPRQVLDATDENLVGAAWAAAVVANVDFVRIQIATVGLWQAVLLSRFTEGVQRPTGFTFPWLATSNVDLRVDTMRGRLPQV